VTQHQIKHAPGELPVCTCGRTPRHFEDHRAARVGGGHFLECCPCGPTRQTDRHATLEAAIQHFCRLAGVAVPVTSSAQQRVRSIR
jgi:hypothetical protein